MPDRYDILVRRARLRGRQDRLFEIGISDGRIAAIGEGLDGTAATEIDARGNLVTESFVNSHLHLCKVWTLPMMEEAALADYHAAGMGKAMTAIELASAVKDNYDASWITDNARRAVALAAVHGNLHIRAFADVDGKARLEGVKALIAVRDEFEGIVDIQVAAFAQDGIVREPGAAELMHEAMELGADVVAGIPWIEYTDADAALHIGICFDLAREFDKDVSMLLDDAGDAGLRTLEAMALEAIRRGWQGRALAHHCRAMCLYPLPYFHRLVGTLKRARVAVVSDPHTGPLHARVKELLDEGVLVCLGQDDISDAYYPFGRNNMHGGRLPRVAPVVDDHPRGDRQALRHGHGRRGAGDQHRRTSGSQVGAPAHLVVLDEPDVVEALRHHAAPAHVISHGRLVDQAKMKELTRQPAR